MQDYAFRETKPKKSNLARLLVFIFFVFVFLGFIKKNFLDGHQSMRVPSADSIISFFSEKPKEDPTSLLEDVKKTIANAEGTWSVYVYDLTTNQAFGINETTIFTAASVNKIPILASLYYLTDKGDINLDQQVTLQAEDIQDYGTGSIRYDPPGTTYSLKTLGRLMMEKSDNTAAYLLGRQIIGFDKVQKLVDAWGLTQTDMENDKSSLADIARLFSMMYRQEITNQSLTTEMLGFLDDSDFEDRIPVLLPKEVKVYHKTGNEIGSVHDVGIVNLEKHPYIIGVFTADVTDEAQTSQTIAQISKIVYEWMKN